ncbi:protease HtpX [Marinimicrobium sp. ABcell2]|uniref:protease HtpX n=1 Tax=Marinimicrobium sp. ABcell2 TaxID=3069751 RepID=UPI0027B7761A|nr:protease HtpX [Marinimicrobium sp. ABcell2]MDQ2077682.1 protease HtpX [Marinimicrobium sp. ABcell2]
MLRIGLFLMTNLAVLLVAGIVLNILGVGHYLDETGAIDLTTLLIFCAVFGFAGSFISLFMSKFIAKKTTGTRIIEQARTADEQWLVRTVEDLARKANIKPPEVGIFPAAQANAFATGWNRNAALVAVSEGMLQRFDKEEIRAVMAHEIGHVANGDMVTLTLVQGVVNTFVMFFARIIGHTVDRLVFKSQSGHGIGFWVTTIVAQMVLAVLASMIVMAFSRYREFRADAAGANLAGRNSMISALKRLQAEVQAGAESPMPDSMKAFGISGGFKQNMSKLFSSHPPLDVRIAALSRG